METIIKNNSGIPVNIQISTLGDIPAGDYIPNRSFLIKNITEDNITITGRLAGNMQVVSTVVYPGWNPEIFYELENVVKNTLQFGY